MSQAPHTYRLSLFVVSSFGGLIEFPPRRGTNDE